MQTQSGYFQRDSEAAWAAGLEGCGRLARVSRHRSTLKVRKGSDLHCIMCLKWLGAQPMKAPPSPEVRVKLGCPELGCSRNLQGLCVAPVLKGRTKTQLPRERTRCKVVAKGNHGRGGRCY